MLVLIHADRCRTGHEQSRVRAERLTNRQIIQIDHLDTVERRHREGASTSPPNGPCNASTRLIKQPRGNDAAEATLHVPGQNHLVMLSPTELGWRAAIQGTGGR